MIRAVLFFVGTVIVLGILFDGWRRRKQRRTSGLVNKKEKKDFDNKKSVIDEKIKIPKKWKRKFQTIPYKLKQLLKRSTS